MDKLSQTRLLPVYRELFTPNTWVTLEMEVAETAISSRTMAVWHTKIKWDCETVASILTHIKLKMLIHQVHHLRALQRSTTRVMALEGIHMSYRIMEDSGLLTINTTRARKLYLGVAWGIMKNPHSNSKGMLSLIEQI